MIPTSFPEQNTIIGEGQNEYQPLPAFINYSIMSQPASFCVALNDDDIADILRGRKIWLQQLTFGGHFKPMMINTVPPVLGGKSESDYENSRMKAFFAITDEMVNIKGDPKALAQIAFVMGKENQDLAVFLGELLKLAKAIE